jgi:carboxylate-amine ligase
MKYHLWERFGVELEYMLVKEDTLDIAPVADLLLFDAGADTDGELVRGAFGWSNELTNHVVELKTRLPVSSFADLAAGLRAEVAWFRAHAAKHGCTLLPTAMHPWMDPLKETKLWPHGNAEIYQTYDRIFGCKGHGWANVQSTHLNLSFCGDAEFARLHAAVRVILPLLPAIAASSPLVEGALAEQEDMRLIFYRINQARVLEIAGMVVPEALFTEADYRKEIYEPIAGAMGALDPEGVLELDFLNSRGAIARFDRGSVEIRLLDIQECPRADLAILNLVVAVLQWIDTEGDLEELKGAVTADLAELLWQVAAEGGNAMVEIPVILKLCGEREPLRAREVWEALFAKVADGMDQESRGVIATILEKGTLAERIRRAVGGDVSRAHLMAVYRELADCLADDVQFLP